MANKAEKFVKRALEEGKFGYFVKNGLSYDHESAANEVYWAICTHLGNPDHWPAEYSVAYKKFCL